MIITWREVKPLNPYTRGRVLDGLILVRIGYDSEVAAFKVRVEGFQADLILTENYGDIESAKTAAESYMRSLFEGALKTGQEGEDTDVS